MTRCPVCEVRVGPCREPDGAPLAQYHAERVRAGFADRMAHQRDAMEERRRLRRDEIRRVAAERNGER